MRLSAIKLQPLSQKRRMRVGRGRRSGHGKSCGRGMKGALARSGAGGRRKFEGGQMPLYRRLPKRGFSNAPFRVEYAVVNVEDLNRFELGTEVNAAALHEKGLVSRGCGIRVKILGRGSLKVALKVVADRFSRTAVEKIRQAGGEVRES